jgi:hypothetical protein
VRISVKGAKMCLKLPQTSCVTPELRFTAVLWSVATVKKGVFEGDDGSGWAMKDVDA